MKATQATAPRPPTTPACATSAGMRARVELPPRPGPARPADRYLGHAAGEEQEHEVWADCGRGNASDQGVGGPADLLGPAAADASPAGGDQPRRRAQGDRRHGGAGAGGRAEHPGRRAAGETEDRQRDDEHQPGHDEADAAADSTNRPPQPPGAEDGQLGGGRSRQQVGGRDAVLELLGSHPAALLDAEATQQGDVRASHAAATDDRCVPLRAPRKVRFARGRRGSGRRARRRCLAWAARPRQPSPRDGRARRGGRRSPAAQLVAECASPGQLPARLVGDATAPRQAARKLLAFQGTTGRASSGHPRTVAKRLRTTIAVPRSARARLPGVAGT